MANFKVGDIAYIVESNNFVRKVTIKRHIGSHDIYSFLYFLILPTTYITTLYLIIIAIYRAIIVINMRTAIILKSEKELVL